MRRLLRILHWQARCRYWRKQAEAAKREVARLQLSLLAERYRNLAREDTFVSATVMGGRNMFGVAPRNGPAMQPESPKLQPTIDVDPWQQLPWADKAEFQTEWWPLAEAKGRSEVQARQDFMAQLAHRRQLNDEPFSN